MPESSNADRIPLPVDDILAELKTALAVSSAAVLQAPPGAVWNPTWGWPSASTFRVYSTRICGCGDVGHP